MAVVVVDREATRPVGSSVRIRYVQCQADVIQGDPVTKDPATNKYYISLNTSEASVLTEGIALTPALEDGYFYMLKIGGTSQIFLGTNSLSTASSLEAGVPFCVGDTAGDIVPYADLTTGDFVKILGVSIDGDILDTNLNNVIDIQT